jgi:two-component system, response regulator, stage 0 sporulation protein A
MNDLSTRLRVLVAEDNADLRAAICALVGGEPDMEVAGATDDPQKIVMLAREHAAHIVVLDLNLRGESSVAAMRMLQREQPQTAAVIYSGYDAADIEAGLRALAPCEYVSKSGDGLDLLAAIRRLGSNAAGSGS